MNWTYCYKIKDGQKETTNLLYTPLKNNIGDTLLLKWDPNEPYHQGNKNLTDELIDFFFKREVKYLNVFSSKPWAPEIKKIDIDNKRIFLEWNNESINAIINDPTRDLNEECPNWKEQIFNILYDINQEGYYKLALYPHCFFINKDKIIKTIDFYSVVEKSNPFIERHMIEGIIGKDSTGRFNQSTFNGVIDFKEFFKLTLLNFLGRTWIKDNPFPKFYERLIND